MIDGCVAVTAGPAAGPQLLTVSSRTISVRAVPVSTPDTVPAYYVMCGKDFGSGTSVALTSVGLPGLGVRLGQHVADPFTPLPKDSAPAQVCIV